MKNIYKFIKMFTNSSFWIVGMYFKHFLSANNTKTKFCYFRMFFELPAYYLHQMKLCIKIFFAPKVYSNNYDN